MKLSPFSARATQLLSTWPTAGETHRWFSRVAGTLAPHLPREKCREFLVHAAQRAYRRVPEREIEGALDVAYAPASPDSAGPIGSAALPWPVEDPVFRAAFLAELGEPPPPMVGKTGDVALDRLFAPTELVCAAADTYSAVVLPAKAMSAQTSMFQYIVANPMKGMSGKTHTGRDSIRTQSNVRERRHLVVEFDKLDKPMQWALLMGLREFLPLVLVVDSAGKSLHGWFATARKSLAAQAQFYGLATALGADPTRWDLAGWVRMPGGSRPGKGVQRILWLQ